MKPYPKYKPTNVSWIGQIPKDWTLNRLRYLADIMPSNIDKKSKDEERQISLCNYVDVYKNDYITKDMSFMQATASDAQIEKFGLKKGDVIATKDSEDYNDIAIPALVVENLDRVVCGYHLTLMRSWGSELIGEFLFWLLNSQMYKEYFSTQANGVTRYGIGTMSFKDIKIVLPSKDEQIKISRFLKLKISEIDSLLVQKQKLIGLLEEEKKAVINRAVTKGINQKAKLKDSGIEWIGKIPMEWGVKKIKFLSKVISKGTTPSTIGKDILPKGDILFIKAENVLSTNVLSKNPINYIDKATNEILKRSQIEENDILIVIAGATIGKVAIATREFIPANTNQAVCFIRLNNFDFVKWLWYVLQSDYIKKIIEVDSVQSAQPNLSMERIGGFPVAIPPSKKLINEVLKILEAELETIDYTISKIKREIELIQEYKTTLITEAIIGKIDIRNYKIK